LQFDYHKPSTKFDVCFGFAARLFSFAAQTDG
jgi:hypothetical protein